MVSIGAIINNGIPHVGEQIFESLDTDDLIQYLDVSKTWRVLAENVLLKRWKGRMMEAVFHNQIKIVELLSKNYNSKESGVNFKGVLGTPFISACMIGRKEIVQLLLKYSYMNEDIDFNAKNTDGQTGFILACAFGQVDVVQVLLEQPYQNIDLNIEVGASSPKY